MTYCFAYLFYYHSALLLEGIGASDEIQPSSSSVANKTPGNNLIKTFAYATDITQTILDLANVSHPATYKGHEVHPLMGKSLKPLLEGTGNKVYAVNETIPGEIINQTSVWNG